MSAPPLGSVRVRVRVRVRVSAPPLGSVGAVSEVRDSDTVSVRASKNGPVTTCSGQDKGQG